MILSFKGAHLALGGPPILENVDLLVGKGERICLAGRNGEGKSTLLNLMAGSISLDRGEVTRTKGLRIGMLPQQVPAMTGRSVFDVVAEGLSESAENRSAPAWSRRHEVEEACTRAGVASSADFSTLSTGLKRRTLLARALVDDPGLLLLDEPTNHLDIESIRWLESTLGRFQGTVVFVTHDRAFLRATARRILELDRGRLRDWTCDYDTFLRRRDEALRVETEQQAQFDRVLAQEEVWIRQGVRERRTRNEGRVRELMKMREERARRRERSGQADFQIQEAGRSGRMVLRARGASFAYGETPIIRDLTTLVQRGDRVGIVGRNGCGKSTLVKLLLGELQPTSGSIEQGNNLEVLYFDQSRDALDDTRTVLENITGGPDTVHFRGHSIHITSYLKQFLFSPSRIHTPITHLSGGERNRLLLAKLFTQPANVLVLDEPTNDLDLETLELLEELLMDYEGTLLLVSHDREFLDHVVTSTLVFTETGAVVETVGGWREWEQTQAPRREKAVKKGKPKPKQERPRKLSFKEARELEALPPRIEELETEQAALHERMADPALYRDAPNEVAKAKAALEKLESELSACYERWEELEALREAAQ